MDIVEAISNATAEDVAKIDAMIEEIKKRINEDTRKMRALMRLRKTINCAISGVPDRKPYTRKPKFSGPQQQPKKSTQSTADNIHSMRMDIVRCLRSAHCAMTPAHLCEKLAINPESIVMLLSHGWFARVDKGYVLTPLGEQQL